MNSHEILPIFVETGDLEDVQDVVDIELGASVGKNGTDEVRMALIVKIIPAAEDIVDYASQGTLLIWALTKPPHNGDTQTYHTDHILYN